MANALADSDLVDPAGDNLSLAIVGEESLRFVDSLDHPWRGAVEALMPDFQIGPVPSRALEDVRDSRIQRATAVAAWILGSGAGDCVAFVEVLKEYVEGDAASFGIGDRILERIAMLRHAE